MERDLAEFVSTLKRTGTAMCFPVGKSLTLALRRFGFEPGLEVILRFEKERVEICPRHSLEQVRKGLDSAARELKELRDRIQAYGRALPPAPDENPESPETLEAELLGLLECLLADDLDPAISKLQSVAELGEPPVPPPAGKARGRRG
ncbi:MAG: hypothetical protein ACJ75H_01345 [Thermoanaerobaculia bacterium]